MNIPNDPTRDQLPENAKGNPVYEQTRQDMPFWCCGRNCGRNSRIVVFVLAIIGIICSIWACTSTNYFSFIAIRNDTFYDADKFQPSPFEFATEADVGLFKYRILDVFTYPWPPINERRLFDNMLIEELRRLQETNGTNVTTSSPGNVTFDDLQVNATTSPNATEPPPTSTNATELPTTLGPNTTAAPTQVTASPSRSPSSSPTSAPTITNPNDIVAETVDIDVIKKYPEGIGQFDSTFTMAQRGAILAPVFAFLGTVFGLVELCCCTYKCSWLPTALFLYLAFMFQLFTLFLFLSEDFCKYAQECALGIAGIMSVLAVICYMIAQSLVCCSPRPPPFFNCCKKPPVRRKKKKKRGDDEDDEFLDPDYDNGDYDDDEDGFHDESNPDYDPYDEGSDENDDYGGYGDEDPYDTQGGDTNDEYTSGNDTGTYGNDTNGDEEEEDSYYTEGDEDDDDDDDEDEDDDDDYDEDDVDSSRYDSKRG